MPQFKVRSVLPRKEAFFGLHFDLHPSKTDTELGSDITEQMIENLLREVRPDYVQYDCKGHAGYTGYPTKIGWPSPGIKRDSLAIWRKVTRRHGVALLIHYSGVWDSAAVEHHPEWACVNVDGQQDKNITSIFGPYVDELLIPQLKEVTDAYDLDGYWIDGECWAVKPDWSEAARKAFTAATGVTKTPAKYGDPHWNEWMAFHRRRFIEYVTRYLNALHSYKPGIEITSNWLYTSLVPQPVEAPVDFLSGDYSPGGSVDHARFEARYLSSTGMPWDLMAWGFNKGENCEWSLKPACQLMQEAASVLAQGGGFQIYYNPTRAGWLDAWMIRIMAEVARFCRVRQAVSYKSQTVPQVALLLSSTSYFNRADRAGRLYPGWAAVLGKEYNPIQGVLHALLELHYSVDVLAEHQISGKMSSYQVIVLPECEVLSDEFHMALLEYVHSGGSLLAIGARTAGLFRDYLGVTFDGDPAEATMFIRSGEMLGWLGGLWQDVTPVSAKCVGMRFPASDTRKNGKCASTVTRLGKGLVAAIYGPLGDVNYRSHVPVLRNFLGEVMSGLFKPMVEVSGPPCIDVTLRRKDGKMMIHLANTAGMQLSPRHAVADFLPPVYNVELTAWLPRKPEKASLAPNDMEISSKWDGGKLILKVPRLEIHNVIVLE